MWHCLPWTLDSNTSWPEAGFSCASRGAIWDVLNAWDRFAGLMDMTQYLQVIHVLWEQQWEAISKGMDTWNKQHLWGTQRLLYLLLPVHIPWCVSGGGEAGGFSSPLPVYNPVASKQVSSTGINHTLQTPHLQFLCQSTCTALPAFTSTKPPRGELTDPNSIES